MSQASFPFMLDYSSISRAEEKNKEEEKLNQKTK